MSLLSLNCNAFFSFLICLITHPFAFSFIYLEYFPQIHISLQIHPSMRKSYFCIQFCIVLHQEGEINVLLKVLISLAALTAMRSATNREQYVLGFWKFLKYFLYSGISRSNFFSKLNTEATHKNRGNALFHAHQNAEHITVFS